MKRIILIVLFVAIAAAVVNDVGRYAKARYDLSNIAAETADSLAREGKSSRDNNARAAASFAGDNGAVVYLYDQDDAKAYVWVQMPVEGTWVLGPAMALVSGENFKTPYYIQTKDSAFFR